MHGAHAAVQAVDLIGFLTLGLLGGFAHCAGMCSPFVLLVARRFGAGAGACSAALVPQVWYNAGRILSYAALGAVAGLVGSGVEVAGRLIGIQRAASIAAGIVLAATAVAALLAASFPLDKSGRLLTRIFALFKSRVPGHPLAIGLFIGLLPCGLLYSAVIAAVARGSALDGAMALALFGIGTSAALLLVSAADELVARRRAVLNRVLHVFMLAMGLWFIRKGLV